MIHLITEILSWILTNRVADASQRLKMFSGTPVITLEVNLMYVQYVISWKQDDKLQALHA